MKEIKFTWDETKNKANLAKHGVGFREATSVFFDDNALVITDPDHSEIEERFLILGLSSALNILVVCHCYRKSDSEIRLISARKATKREQRQYSKRG